MSGDAMGGRVESVLAHPYVAALGKPVRRPKVSGVYVLMLAVVAGVMVVLVAVYLGMIAALGYAVYWHAVNNVVVFAQVRSVRGALAAYLGPLIVGVILIGFLIKPLFARRQRRYSPQALSRRDEPLLFAFVDRLCDTLGAPRPSAIHIDMDLNASASFASFLSGVLGGKLVLTLGLPLVAGLSLNELTGVLAHEFGHFSQRSAMRLSYIIRSIDGWFARVVYERDAWDAQLDETVSHGGHWGLQLVALLARCFVWLSRRVLWVLMMFGELVSSMLLRQMEFDADRCSAALVGAKATQEMLRKLPVLDVAIRSTYGDLSRALAEKRLPDNVPALVTNRVADFPKDQRSKLEQMLLGEKTGWFASHPATAQRIASVGREAEAGIFSEADVPASALVGNFETVSRMMTRQFYEASLGPQAHSVELVPVSAIEGKRQERAAQGKYLTTYFGDLLHPFRAVFPESSRPEGDADALAERVMSCRGSVAEKLKAAQEAAGEWGKVDEQLWSLEVAGGLIGAGVRVTGAADLGLARSDLASYGQRREELLKRRMEIRRRIDAVAGAAVGRMCAALEIGERQAASLRPAAGGDDLRLDLAEHVAESAVAKKLAALALKSSSGQLEELRRLFAQQAGMLKEFTAHRNEQGYVDAVLSGSRRMCKLLGEYRAALAGVAYPFAEAGREMGLVEFVFSPPTQAEDVGATMGAAERAMDQVCEVYMRAMGSLAEAAEQVELELGLGKVELAGVGG